MKTDPKCQSTKSFLPVYIFCSINVKQEKKSSTIILSYSNKTINMDIFVKWKISDLVDNNVNKKKKEIKKKRKEKIDTKTYILNKIGNLF